MKMWMPICALLLSSLTVSADPGSERFTLSCQLGDRQSESSKEVALSQVKNFDGNYVKTAELKMSSEDKIELNVRVLGNRVSISTIANGQYIRVQGNQMAELEIRQEGAESTDLLMTCKLK